MRLDRPLFHYTKTQATLNSRFVHRIQVNTYADNNTQHEYVSLLGYQNIFILKAYANNCSTKYKGKLI